MDRARRRVWWTAPAAIAVAVAVVITACGDHPGGWVGKVVEVDAEHVCVTPRAGVEQRVGPYQSCFDRDDPSVRARWRDLEVGTCVHMLGYRETNEVVIDGTAEPESC